jgi:hypothetical protein
MNTKLRVCARALPEHLSLGIHRVANALIRYAPDWVKLVDDPDTADLRIGHCIGIQDMEAWCAKGPYALVQYCLLTGGGSREEWASLWKGARAVWSYYDLNEFLRPLREQSTCGCGDGINFYHAPLGVDTSVFRPSMPARKPFLIGTSGFIAATESVEECHEVVKRLGRRQFHLGPTEMELGDDVTYMLRVPDAAVADMWSQCTFVAGLRRIEGFELPVLEGLACGARPIVFDAPHYSQWFGEHVEYVPEVAPAELVDALMEIMSKPVRPVTPAERSLVAATFDWKKLVAGFWEAVR